MGKVIAAVNVGEMWEGLRTSKERGLRGSKGQYLEQSQKQALVGKEHRIMT